MMEDFDFQDLKVGEDYQLENKDMENKYSFGKGLLKGAVSFVLFLVPVILTNNPAWANLTVGAVLVMILNFIKFRYKQL